MTKTNWKMMIELAGGPYELSNESLIGWVVVDQLAKRMYLRKNDGSIIKVDADLKDARLPQRPAP